MTGTSPPVGQHLHNADWISFEEAKGKYNSLKKERVR